VAYLRASPFRHAGQSSHGRPTTELPYYLFDILRYYFHCIFVVVYSLIQECLLTCQKYRTSRPSDNVDVSSSSSECDILIGSGESSSWLSTLLMASALWMLVVRLLAVYRQGVHGMQMFCGSATAAVGSSSESVSDTSYSA